MLLLIQVAHTLLLLEMVQAELLFPARTNPNDATNTNEITTTKSLSSFFLFYTKS
ncbi:hypothetical protein HYV49_04650 [Candidatus Pacearchaeota archaeon]|nr:hypothetical protein [Candidatus Pacearchaeota archaeon]